MTDQKKNDPEVLLIDSFAQIFRCYYAVRALSNKAGEPTNAIFGMMRFLLQLEEKYPGAKGAFVFDKGRPPHRMKLAPAYKANRPPTPEDLLAQLPAIRELISAFGWRIIEAQDCEADDLIASLAVCFSDVPIKIISADKDLAQIVDDRIEMLVPDHTGKGFNRRGAAEVLEKFGVPPSRIVDYLALIGDSADNIPGIAGVGPKTAAALLQKFGSIENMLAHSDEIERESLRQKICEGKDLLATNVALVKLVTDPPEGNAWSPESLDRTGSPDAAHIRRIAEAKELRSMFKDIDALDAGMPLRKETPAVSLDAEKTEMEQLSLF